MTSPPYYPVVVGTPVQDPAHAASNVAIGQPQYGAGAYPQGQYPAATYSYQQGYNPQGYGGPQNYADNPPPNQQNAIAQPVVLEIQSEPAMSRNQVMLLHYARTVRWFAVIDCFILIIYVLVFFWLLILLPLPILGYFSGYRLNRPLAAAYIIFIMLMIILRVLLMAVFQYVVFIVLALIAIAFEVFIMIRVIRFFRLMGTMNLTELESCRAFIRSGRRN
jgi:hypothetical protein